MKHEYNMMKQKYQYFAVIFSCLICINGCVSAAIAKAPIESSKSVAIHQEDLLVRELLSLALLLNNIPFIGPKLMIIPEKIIRSIGNFEYTTNHLVDKILRNSLPCMITVNGIKCEGIEQNGGLVSIIRNAIDSMPNTRIFYIIKQILDVMTFALQVLYLWGIVI
ncbi:PREDICTED: uncharacterized protein LOC106793723 [Polistes canadensis]|uniref:uncharacterized protein LOC106793723 n=1 Tax=Polistes canadensis TaxID=91411 RepID=UPI000718D302|nr:PREDICTED: uncharacterized protein LOC106793723 [Polistes canadensis]